LVSRAARPNKPEGDTHWARLKTPVDLPLRLGAWYRVVAPVTALEVVVSIQGTRVSVPRPYVELRATPPGEWTVVRNPKVRPERTPQGLRQAYIVCPGCRRRVELPATRLARSRDVAQLLIVFETSSQVTPVFRKYDSLAM